jgi:hypothetical protein
MKGLFEPGPVSSAAEQEVHHRHGFGCGIVKIASGLRGLGNPADGAAHAARGVQGSRHQGSPGRTLRPQSGSPNDGIARGMPGSLFRKAALRPGAAIAAKMSRATGLLGDLAA